MRFSLDFIQRIYRLGILLVIVLVIVDLLTFFYYPDSDLSDIFLATREQTPLTWFSSLVFLFIALPSFSLYLETKKKVWFFLSAAFFFFSLDDATYLHERLSGFLADNTHLFSFFPSYIWIIVYFPILAFSLCALVYLLWKKSSRKSRRIIILALVFLGTAVLLDMLDGLIQKNSTLVFCIDQPCHLSVLHLVRLAEEVLEILALGILGYLNIKKHCLLENDKKWTNQH